MTAVKSSVTDAGDFRDHKTVTPLKVLKEIDTDVESNASSSEDSEFYSPKSVVVKKWPPAAVAFMKEVNGVCVSRARVHNPILRIRAEDRQIGEDIGEGLVSKLVCAGNDIVDVMVFCRPSSPLGGKMSAIESDH